MPEVTVRKRKARRSRPPQVRAKRWVAKHRPRVIVGAAFVIAFLVAVVVMQAAQGMLSGGGSGTEAAPSQ